jgi:hypothetical protein
MDVQEKLGKNALPKYIHKHDEIIFAQIKLYKIYKEITPIIIGK